MSNKRAMYILAVFCIMFITLISYITYVELRFGDQYTQSIYNARNAAKDMKIIRGSIYDRNMTKLAYSEESESGITRKYPYDNLYSHVIGYVSKDYKSRTLLEQEYNSDLLGGEGLNKILNLKDTFISNKNKGNDLILTIDHELQNTAYSSLGSYDGSIVALDINTGEVLAMVSKPDFNPNPDIFEKNFHKLKDSTLYSRAIQMLYPPGSTFKTVATASIIENDMSDETYNDTNGEFIIKSADGNPKNDYRCKNEDAKHAYGETDLEKAFTVSSNVYYAYIGTKLSSKQLQNTAYNFMFNRSIDFDLPIIQSKFQNGSMTEAERAISIIGQGKTEATPMHMALIAATIANDGKMPHPRLVSKIKSKNITTYNAGVSNIGQIIPKNEAKIIKDMMRNVVKSGTGKNAAIYGIDVCGKTGTSENATTAKGGAYSSKTHSIFIGFAPYDNPKIAICVVMEYAGFGATHAAPAAKRVIEKYFELYPIK